MNEQQQQDNTREVVLQNPYGQPVPVQEGILSELTASSIEFLTVPRRADWAFNPNDAYICDNGHLQTNVTPEELDAMVLRGEVIKPIAYAGGLCKICPKSFPFHLVKLTNDPKELQQKLGTQMQLVAQLQAMITPLQANNLDLNDIALFLRAYYAHEIAEGQPQHAGSASKAVIFYLKKERGRVIVKVGQWFRALKRGLGVG